MSPGCCFRVGGGIVFFVAHRGQSLSRGRGSVLKEQVFPVFSPRKVPPECRIAGRATFLSPHPQSGGLAKDECRGFASLLARAFAFFE
ncbi:UNVERIFIED_CONTAM: hypothetical protein HHA_219470 [Hammondia hammondi]|eukprot:XP_008889420.1 hypothetical protein HHA_219470 [Hammondia hammondi]